MNKEFRIGDLFEIINNPQLDRVNFNFDEHAEYPYFTRTENNNGILGYVDYLDDEHKIQGNSLAVGMISMKFHYMAHDFYAGQFTKTLIPKFDEFNEVLALYFIVVLNKHSEQYQGFLVRHFKDKVSETAVSLPVIASSDPNHTYTVDDIDWQYMQDRIAELEQDRIAELEAYLAATGLDDYALTAEDKAVLCDEKVMAEFRIGDVFYKIDTPKIKAKANDFSTEYSEEYSIPLLTAGAENQGLNRWAKPSDCSMVINNVISVSANGANSGVCFYQPCDFAVLQDAYAVKVHNHEIGNVEEGLYLTGALNKAVRDNHSWVNKAGWNRIKDDIVELPVIESSDPNHVYTVDDIDWQYMQDRIAELEQDRIAELEQDRIAELEAYLAATGLDDYELTDEDKAVLCDEKVMKTYRLGEVFSVENVNKLSIKGKNYIMDKDIVSEDGTTPYIAAISTNNGITGYSNYSANNKGDCITLSTTADSSNTVFYQEQSFIGRQQIAGIRRIDGKIMERYVGLYLTAAIRKITRQFNYANKLTKEYLKNCDILLPVIESADPNHTYTIDDIDWQYMERYIRAMEKLAITDVVKYKDKVIATTKQVVEQ